MADKMAVDDKKPKTVEEHLLEEDDEFEEFPAEGWLVFSRTPQPVSL